jgi:hypothetical protein
MAGLIGSVSLNLPVPLQKKAAVRLGLTAAIN